MRQLAKRYGVHRLTVAAILGRLAVPVREQGITDEDLPLLTALYNEGWSLTRLADRFGCSAETIRQTLMQLGVSRRKTYERGPRS